MKGQVYARRPCRSPALLTIAPPVQVFHPVFQEFLDGIDDPALEPDEEVVSAISELMLATMEIHPSGYDAFGELRPLFAKLLGGYVGEVMSNEERTPVGMRFKQLPGCIIPLVCVEYERTFGEGRCDPSTRAAYSVREFLVLKRVCGFRMFLHLY